MAENSGPPELPAGSAGRLQALNERLRQSNEDLADFAQFVAHDLKEPMRVVRHHADAILERARTRLMPDETRYLEDMSSQIRHLERFIDDLLQFSRLDGSSPELGMVDLNEVVEEVLAGSRSWIEERAAVVMRRPLPTVCCDRVCVAMVFRNLIANALKYTHRPRPRIEIGATMPSPDSDAPPMIYVKDDGVGIAGEHREAVFDPYRRLHGKDDFGGGTGVGLAIVKKLVQRQDGRIWVQQDPHAGSVFWFTLDDPKGARPPS